MLGGQPPPTARLPIPDLPNECLVVVFGCLSIKQRWGGWSLGLQGFECPQCEVVWVASRQQILKWKHQGVRHSKMQYLSLPLSAALPPPAASAHAPTFRT